MLSKVEELADPIDSMLANSTEQPKIVDCVAIATLQFSDYVYGLGLVKEHPRLLKWYRAFPEETHRVERSARIHQGGRSGPACLLSARFTEQPT
jgi:hypothetical protein